MESCTFVDWISLLVSIPIIGVLWLMCIGCLMIGWRYLKREFINEIYAGPRCSGADQREDLNVR